MKLLDCDIKRSKDMFIWDWVSIAFGWLVFLFLMLFIIAFVKQVVKEIKK